MKSLMLLWSKLALDCASRCCTDATMDIKTVQDRSICEGLSFFTITLPKIAEDLQKGLEQSFVDRRLFSGFRGRGELPLFLGGFLDLIFDRTSGALLHLPSIDAIASVRQLSLTFSKLELPCSDARERAAFRQFMQCEQDVKQIDRSLGSLSDFHRISSLLFAGVFTEVDRKVFNGEIVPKHGPGATADKLRANAKYLQSTWTRRLDEYFPVAEYLLPSPSYWEDLDAVDILEPGAEMPVKVISVPKTLKTPRIIAVEPTAMQYAQQGIAEAIVFSLEHDSPLIRKDHILGMIGFADQEVNQRLSCQGSSLGDLATLDLKEASDRVSNQLVRTMLCHHPHLMGAVDACRSRRADVPGYGVIRLSKFASMGSALTFPIEAMVFLTLVFVGIERELNAQLTRNDILSFKGQVRVYGDDLIVPVPFVPSVISVLEDFGLLVNRNKSFWNGKFRESCGKEYYDGFDVSVVKFRRIFPTKRMHVQEIQSLVAFRNLLYLRGYWSVCQWLDQIIRKILKYFPVILPESPGIGRLSFLGYQSERDNPYLFRPEVRAWVVSPVIPSSPLSGAGALLKYFLKRGSLPSADREHLERAGRPHAVNIKLRWVSAV